MLIYRRNAMFGGGGWKNPYVTDGLVAMWDSEWNAGPGKHDPSASEMFDLSGNGHNITFVGGHEVHDNHVRVNGVQGAYASVQGLTYGTPVTMEGIIKINRYQDYGRIVAENRGLRMALLGNIVAFCIYGWGVDGGPTVVIDASIPHLIGLKHDGATIYAYSENNTSSAVNSVHPTYSGITTLFNRTSLGRGIDADLYNYRLYSRALTADEVAANYAVDKARFNLPDAT